MITVFMATVFTNPIVANAQTRNILGFSDPPACVKDNVLPVLVICGRNVNSAGACTEYARECTLPDLVSIAGRILVFIILLALLIIPLIIMYTGAKIMYGKNSGSGGDMIKNLKKIFQERIVYFILLLAAWLIVRTIVDLFQVDTRINTFLLDENGRQVKARQVIIN